MPELAGHRIGGHRGALIQCLEPGGAVCVPEGLRPDLPGLEAGSASYPVEQVAHVADHLLRG